MFVPVKPDFPLPGFPGLTAVVCVVCALVFFGQLMDRHEYDEAVRQYCEMPRSRIEQIVLDRIKDNHQLYYCDDIGYILHNADDQDKTLALLMNGLKPLTGLDPEASRNFVATLLAEELGAYRRIVPPDPDDGLAYYSETWNPATMLTSVFAHGGWAHLVFNLIFFAAFGSIVELLVWRPSYIALIVAIALINGVFTSLSTWSSGIEVASLGLSGVVMGMIGMSAYLLPRARIRCYYWFIILFGSVALPVWTLALWYLGGDLYALFAFDDHGAINVMAHVTGGIGGYLFGFLFLKKARLDAEGLQMAMDRSELRPRFF